ncbi:Uncharacterised protein [Vibrio cholerae]|nr:Uncharacterised protein [Vibrio cholerae]
MRPPTNGRSRLLNFCLAGFVTRLWWCKVCCWGFITVIYVCLWWRIPPFI